MNKERMLAKIGYGAVIAFILAVTLLVSCVAKASPQAQPPQSMSQTTVEALPVTCTTPEEAGKTVGDAFDTMLLSGKSGVSGFGTAVLFNRNTKHYVIVILTSDNHVCFVDMGRGESAVLQRFI